MKICSLYGAGFYYIPGTDICMKIGGYIRWQETFNPGSSSSGGPFFGTGARHTRLDTQDFQQRVRAIATFDTRQQTQYGVLRTYLLLGYTHDSSAAASAIPGSLYMTRGFIQFAGFTFGKATSFFDFASTASAAYNAGFLFNSDTGDPGQLVAAYTAQFGNGFSGTLSVEQNRSLGVVNLTASGTQYNMTTLADPIGSNLYGLGVLGVGGQDVVGNLRVDQAWGSAQVSAAAHQVGATYYQSTTGIALLNGTEANGHPGDEWGWAGSFGIKINLPMIAAGDFFQGQVVYTEGALRYAAQFPTGAAQNQWSGGTVGYGFWEDAVYTNPGATAATGAGSIQLTTAWSAFASVEHYWTPAVHSSAYGSYIDVSHNAVATAAICATQANSATATSAFQAGGGAAGAAAASGVGCNPDWNAYAVGSRTQWDIVPGFYVGLDVIYLKLHTATPNAANILTVNVASGAKAPGFYSVQDQDTVAATVRVHRDVLP